MAKQFMTRAEGRALFVHVDEDFAEAAVLVFACAHVEVVARDVGFLGVACAAVGQLLAAGDVRGLHGLRARGCELAARAGWWRCLRFLPLLRPLPTRRC